MSKPLLVSIALLLVTGCAQGYHDETQPIDDTPFDDVPGDGGYFDVTHSDPLVIDPHAPTISEIEPVLGGELPAPRYMGEEPACLTVFDAYHRRGLELGCATTTHVCPELLRFPFGEACLLYYATTVQNCEDRILAANSCETLWTTSCGIQAVANSAPLGCPADP